jgi:cytochrome c oxidase assembly factor CtaG
MNPIAETALQSWRFEAGPLIALSLTAAIYWRGWLRLHRRLPLRFTVTRLLSFFGGLTLILIAFDSPLDAFDGLLLTAHMTQHLLLMMAVPPLLLYGNPFLPLLRGLPRSLLKDAIQPLLESNFLRKFGRTVTHPLVCWLAYVASTIAWHVPAAFELALRSPALHIAEHACFLGTGILLWWPVIQPWPGKPVWPRLALIPYLFLADFQNTALSAYLMFCDRVVYPTYAAVPRVTEMSALQDQATAGAIMWVPGSFVFLIPVVLISLQAVSTRRAVRPLSQRFYATSRST